jgi:ABC-2 type transport system permease protein
MQPLTVINPIHHFAVIARASMLKGSGFAELWPHFLGLIAITAVLGVLSIWRFRGQVS